MKTWVETKGRAEARIEFGMLGGMTGTLAAWPDGFVLGRLVSQRVIPPEKRDEAQGTCARENMRNRRFLWECDRGGRVTLQVRGRQVPRNPLRWKESAVAELTAKMTAMHERIGDWFAAGVLT
ncbi:MAG TPA: hypothetical protein VNA25_03105 [Phycisphaerae bacterium]|nr:hypothetical protein [Phycisphaerae bacterium]